MQDRTEFETNGGIIELFTELLQAFEGQKAKEIAAYGTLDEDDDSNTMWPGRCHNDRYHRNWELIGNERFEVLCQAVDALLSPAGLVRTELHPQIGYYEIKHDEEGRPVDWSASLLVKQAIFAQGSGGILFDVDCADIIDCLGDGLFSHDAYDARWAESALFRITAAVAACLSLAREGRPCALSVRATVVRNGSDDWSVAPPERAAEASAVVLVTGDEDAVVAPICDISATKLFVYRRGASDLDCRPEDISATVKAILDAIASSPLVRSSSNEEFSQQCAARVSENGFEYDSLSLSVSCDVLSPWSVTSEMIAEDLEARLLPLSEQWKVQINERHGMQIEDEAMAAAAESYGSAAASAVGMSFKRSELTRFASIYASRNPRTVAFGIGGQTLTNLLLRSADLTAKLVKMAEVADEAASADERAKNSKKEETGSNRNRRRR